MKPLNLSVVGLGRLGRIHAENIAFRIPNVNLSAVCSLDQSQLDEANQSLGQPEIFTSFDEMIQQPDLNGVVIVSPSDLHCEQIEKSLKRGLHVFCEKPLGTRLADCERTEKLIKDFDSQVFMLGFMRRYDPSYKFAKEQIDAGYIGKPILFRSYSVDPESAIEDVLKYMEHSAGQFLDMAVHDIDLARWYLKDEPRSIYAVGDCYAHPEFAKFNDGDNVGALMQFQKGAMAFILAGRTAPHGYNVETEIIGTKATLRIASVPAENMVELLDGQGVRKLCSYHFADRFKEAFLAEITEFVSCIHEGRQPDVTAKDGVEATRIALAATASFQQDELVKMRER